MAKKQKVKFDRRGAAYLTHYGRRIYLDEVMRCHSGGNIAIGYYSNNYKVYILGYDDDGDAVGMVEFIAVSH